VPVDVLPGDDDPGLIRVLAARHFNFGGEQSRSAGGSP
jgi:hypothetical protein